MLHDDIELFEQVIVRTSEKLNVELPIVEKDYYVTMFLKEDSGKTARNHIQGRYITLKML